ncbi:MAG: hypothetical protein ACREH6_13255 [Geminicoccaceae bacterium]
MSAFVDYVRACILTVAIVATVAVGTAGVALWQAHADQPGERVWIKSSEHGCRHVPVSQAIDALPCHS